MEKNARKTPFVLTIVVTSVLLVMCLTGTILYASLAVNQSKSVPNVGVVGALSATVTSNTITVTNDMDCVLRVAPTASGVTFSSTQWFKQDNGWYYYYRVIKQNDTAKAITLTGATNSNITVELAQAQYVIDTTSTTGKKAGFVVEWSSRDVRAQAEVLGTYTSDGLDITKGDTIEPSTIVMYSGHDTNRRVPSTSTNSSATSQGVFQATKQSSGSYAFDKINLSSVDGAFEAISTANAISLYNNATATVVYTIQVITNEVDFVDKTSTFSNGNWTTYVALTSAPQSFVLASESTATSGYTTYFVSKPVAPGEYVELTKGTDNVLKFTGQTADSIGLYLSVSIIDTMTFYNSYVGKPEKDNYLAWLKSLDSNYSGKTYFNDFKKLISSD